MSTTRIRRVKQNNISGFSSTKCVLGIFAKRDKSGYIHFFEKELTGLYSDEMFRQRLKTEFSFAMWIKKN